MFNIERWQEIFETIRKNKLRTFLTGVSVASGIFILVILLGVGQGMQNGISKEFEQDASNRISIWSNVTSKEFKGLNPGRFIQLTNQDFDFITKKYEDDIEYKSSVNRKWGALVSYKKESGTYRIEGVYPDYQFLENAEMVAGRFLNLDDEKHAEKVAIIGQKVSQDLFGKKGDAIGEYIQVDGINFKVVGVFTDPGGEREETRVYLPRQTHQRVFNEVDKIRNMAFTLQPEATFDETVAASTRFTEEIESFLKSKHIIAPDDESAIGMNNSLENAKRFYQLIFMIKSFFWWVGICTIIAGVVGVSNIMLIIVKERTKEIGIRKALGAMPGAIIAMILQEAIFVTALAGFTGLIAGLLLLELIAPMVQTDFLRNPSVDFNVAITTVIILVLAGALAGFIPAWKAARIKPIVALRDE